MLLMRPRLTGEHRLCRYVLHAKVELAVCKRIETEITSMSLNSRINETGKPSLVAFVHIEKAAGTTLIHILRHVFCGAYIDARPLRRESCGVFTSSDLRAVRKILPALRCIAGHSVVPHSDLLCVNYITLLRDPVKRYLSHYQHWVERKGRQMPFEAFLELDEMRNFQTKKIAGSDDVDKAKAILRDRFSLVGFVETFDSFLVLLAALTDLPSHLFQYVEENRALNTIVRKPDYDCYMPAILQNNAHDLDLYSYVKEVLFPSYIVRHGRGFQSELESFVSGNISRGGKSQRHLLDYILRKLYLEPITGGLRAVRGLPYRGSY